MFLRTLILASTLDLSWPSIALSSASVRPVKLGGGIGGGGRFRNGGGGKNAIGIGGIMKGGIAPGPGAAEGPVVAVPGGGTLPGGG